MLLLAAMPRTRCPSFRCLQTENTQRYVEVMERIGGRAGDKYALDTWVLLAAACFLTFYRWAAREGARICKAATPCCTSSEWDEAQARISAAAQPMPPGWVCRQSTPDAARLPSSVPLLASVCTLGLPARSDWVERVERLAAQKQDKLENGALRLACPGAFALSTLPGLLPSTAATAGQLFVKQACICQCRMKAVRSLNCCRVGRAQGRPDLAGQMQATKACPACTAAPALQS